MFSWRNKKNIGYLWLKKVSYLELCRREKQIVNNVNYALRRGP